MRELSIERMEMVIGSGPNWNCVGAVGGALLLFSWSLSVPLTGGVTLGLAAQGAGITAGTIALAGKCMG
ncbi:hypothetical protein ACFSKL_19400 [Belliella marina]|uniref:Uncharacterized protein n=1 Tax=Belliella marina TaxID=1644146 RepID=A0ABW4VQP2_9BACT